MINLENRLFTTALQTARSSGMDFTVPCAHNLRDLIQAGTGVMRRANRVTEADLELAGNSLSIMTNEMVRLTRGLGDAARSGNKIRIREGALSKAKGLGPLWPFG